MTLMIGDKSVVKMHYKLKDDDGQVLDSSEGAEPLAYLHGAGNIIAGLEKALVGKSEGDSLQVKIDPAEGYGEIVQDLIQTVDKSEFKDLEPIKEGMALESKASDGSIQNITVMKIDGEKVTIDGNHPLAGAVLHFDVTILNVRDATEEEVAHGHIH